MSEKLLDFPLLLTLDADAHRQLATSVREDFKHWKQARSRLEAKWQECWEAYLCDVKSMYTEPDTQLADRSRIVRPVLYESVEAIHSNLLNALFPGNEKFFTVLGKTERDQKNAKIIEEFLQSKLEETGFLEKFSLFLKQAIITGNSVAAIPWRRVSQPRQVEEPLTLLGVTVGYQKVQRPEVVYNGPDFEVIDIFDFLVDPDATDFQHAKVIRKIERSLQDLHGNPSYHNLEQLTPKSNDHWHDTDNRHKASKRRAFGIDEQNINRSEQPERVTLLEAWGDFRIGDTVYSNHVCVVANDNTVIRFEPNPYDCGLKPFVFTGFIPIPNEVYGLGAIEKSLGLQHAINTLTNQKLDVINLSINSPFTYLINDDVFDPDNMITRPGALIPVKSHDTLRPIQYLNNYTVAFNEITDLKTEIQEATGALKYFTGAIQAEASRTATEVNALVQGGSQKFSSFLAHLEHTSLVPFLRMAFEQAKQFVREPESLRILEQNGHLAFKQILPEILRQSQCTFRVDGTRGLMHKEQELTALSTFLRLVEKSPALQGRIDVLSLYKKVYRRLGFTDEGDVFIPESPQMNRKEF